MCCAVVTRDAVFPRPRQAHPTVHAVSPSGVPLVLRQRSHVTPNASDGIRQVTTQQQQPGPPPGGGAEGNKHSVLPPIKDSGRKREQDFSLSELEDISLKNEVVRRMREVSERSLQGLLANLRSQDRDRDGILSTDIAKGALKRFQLHLSEDGLRNLCKKFGQSGQLVAQVRYEEMFTYLTRSRMEALRAPPPAAQQQPRPGGPALNSQQQQQEPQQHQQQQQRKINQRNRVMFNGKDEANMIQDLERQLAGKPVRMADLRRTMYHLDRDRNDYLSGQQVEVALSKCGFHLTPDVRARLLLATDRTGAGMHKIEALMDYLTRIIPEGHNIITLGNDHQPRQARVGQLPVNPNQPYEPQEVRTEFQQDEGFSEDIQQQQTAPVIYALPPPPEADLAFDVQKWSSDYQYLAQAVYNADEDQSGYMLGEEVQRVTSTYNLVYNLGISENSLSVALNTAIDPNYGEVNLEYFIATLQDLHFKENGAY